MWLNPVPIPVEDRRLRCPYSLAIRKSHTLGHIFAKYVLLTVFDKLRMTSGFSVTNFNIFFQYFNRGAIPDNQRNLLKILMRCSEMLQKVTMY